MPKFEPMKPPDNLVDGMIKYMMSNAWAICPKVKLIMDYLICSDTSKRCFVFQDGKNCINNPLNREG